MPRLKYLDDGRGVVIAIQGLKRESLRRIFSGGRVLGGMLTQKKWVNGEDHRKGRLSLALDTFV